MTDLQKLKQKWMKDPGFKKEYENQTLEFKIAQKLIAERLKAKLTQADIAKKMGTTQSAVARLESGDQLPTMKSIERYANALGKYPEIRFKDAS